MAIKKDSAGYVVGFALAVCLVCSLGVSAAAIFLSDRQEENATVARQKKVLDVAGLLRPGEQLSNAEVAELFEARFVPQLVNFKTGELVAEVDGLGPADYQPLEAAKAAKMKAPSNDAKVRYLPEVGKLYYLVDERGQIKKIIVPIEGYGLWGFLYGFLALEADGETIAGITYYDHKETPGLGGEVDNPNWKGKWKGKKLYLPGETEPAVEVVKNASGDIEVDALSGATITGRGVTYMMDFWFGPEAYGPFLQKVREGGPPAPVGAPSKDAAEEPGA